VRRYEQRAESTVIFVVDASGSSALQRLAEAKGAVELLLADAYARRTQVALIAFRGSAAELLLPPTRSLTRARRSLAELAGGGATPLAAAIELAARSPWRAGQGPHAAAHRADRRPRQHRPGRRTLPHPGGDGRDRRSPPDRRRRRHLGPIDTSPRPRGDGARLAEAMGARFAPLPYVEASAVRQIVQSLDAGR
jgi:magnesium chelatase subunit D